MVLVASIVLAMVVTTYQWGSPLVEKSQTNSIIVQAQDNMAMIKQRINEVALSGEQKSFNVKLDGTFEVVPEKNSIIYSVSTAGLGLGSFLYVPLDSSKEAIAYDTYILNATTGGIVTIGGIDYSVAACAGNDGAAINGTFRNVGDIIHPTATNYTLDHVDCSGVFDKFTVISGPEVEVFGVLGSDEAGVIMAKTVFGGKGYLTQMRLAYRELDDVTSLEGRKIKIVSDGNKLVSGGAHTIFIRRGNVERIPGAAKLGQDLITTNVYVSVS